MKRRILAFADWYLPGNKGGGSVSAISNLIELIGDDFLFYVITRNCDNTDAQPYADVCPDRWLTVGKAQLFYASDLSLSNLHRRIRKVNPDILYLNSFFSRLTMRVLFLRRFGVLPATPVVLAPRGEFSPGALEIKQIRKLIYRKVAFATGLCRDAIWQASSWLEEEQVRAMLSRAGPADVLLAPDAPSSGLLTAPPPPRRSEKTAGAVRFVFLSRISRKKNLHFALKLLGLVDGEVQLDICGPIDDGAYWKACQEQIRRLPASVKVSYRGSIPKEQIAQVFSESHFHLLPTRGENFGFVILEALAAGCPVVISDQTPWRELSEKAAGWALSLDDRAGWQKTLQHCVDMDQTTYETMSRRSRSYFEEWVSTSPFRRNTVELFQKAFERRPDRGVPRALRNSTGAGGATAP